MDGILAGRPAGDVADTDHDDGQGKCEGDDADNNGITVTGITVTVH